MLHSKYTNSLLAVIFVILFHACNNGEDIGNREESGRRITSSNLIQPDSFKHIILTWEEDPKFSQAVTWQTEVPLKRALAQVATSDPSPNFSRNSRQVHAETAELETDNGTAYYHSVNFTNLHPDSLYAYRVGDGKSWSEWFQFRTAAENSEPFSFIYFGDVQRDIYSLWSRIVRAAFLDASKARFIIYAGDLVGRRNSASQWDEWHKAAGWIMAMVPCIPVVGNHEYIKSEKGPRTLTKFWKPQFRLPGSDRSDFDETVYHLDFQGVRVIVLNSNLAVEDQANWLENLLANNPNRWTIIAFHHPIYSSARGRNNEKLIKYWKPVFEKYNVDLVLQGHDHVYARGRGLRSAGEDCRGPVYITSVSGPQMYKLDRTSWMDRAAENTQLYQVISIAPSTLKFKAVTATGEVYDAFDLTKKEGCERALVNRTPPNSNDYRF